MVEHLLLKNSKLPKNLNFNTDLQNQECKNIKAIIQINLDMHKAIENYNIDEIKRILIANSKITHFYNLENESAATVALRDDKLDIYDLLIKNFRPIGPKENVSEIFRCLNDEDELKLGNLHSEQAKPAVKHIALLLSKTVVCHDDENYDDHYKLVYEMFATINDIKFQTPECIVPIGNWILKLIAFYGNFKIHFDFQRSSVQYMCPKDTNEDTRGLTYPSGDIFIGVEDLLDPRKMRSAIAVAFHEFTHLAMYIVFNNDTKPYAASDDTNNIKFSDIVHHYFSKEDQEVLIQNFYNNYDVEQWAEEFVAVAMLTPMIKNTMSILEKLKNNIHVSYKRLTKPLKDKILNSRINFQGKCVCLKSITEYENDLEKLSLSQLKALISNQNHFMTIGHKVVLKEEEKHYIESDFIERELFDGNSLKLNKENYSSEWINNIIKNSNPIGMLATKAFINKVVLLSGLAGVGKTTTFKHLSIKLKNMFPRFWVSYIDLKQKLKAFKIYEEKFKNEDKIIELLQKFLIDILNLQNDFEKEIFKVLFNLHKVVLLFDAVDEISPTFKKFFLKIAKLIKDLSGNEIWITTRPHHILELKLFSTLLHIVCYHLTITKL